MSRRDGLTIDTQNSKELDPEQKKLLERMYLIADTLGPKSYSKKIRDLLSGSRTGKGIYLYGSVGRGKTMLMRMFYDKVEAKKEIIHFQKFMQELHKKLHLLKTSADKLIRNLAYETASRVKVICIDEFEVNDIADAMIVMSLFKYLLKKDVFIFLTTNTAPDNLYKDGMHRESFAPFISMIKSKFCIMCPDSDVDYRYKALAAARNKILYPADSITESLIKEIEEGLNNREPLLGVSIESFGRRLAFSKGHKNALVTDFTELFERPIGYADYVTLTERFKIIVVRKVRNIQEAETDILTRFINFVDNVYFNKSVLFMEIESSPESLYSAVDRRPEFNRTVSRLIEMNSSGYF